MERNQIYCRLITHDDQIYERFDLHIGMAIAIISGVMITAALYYSDLYRSVSPIALFLGGFGVSLVVLIPVVALMMTTQFARRYASEESFALIRLTHVTPQDIGDAYVEAAKYRLRWLGVIALGLIPLGLIGLSYISGLYTIIIDCFTPCGPGLIFSYMMAGFVPSLFISVPLFIFGRLAYDSAIYSGVWIGFRWKERGILIAAAISLISLMIAIPILISVVQGLLLWSGPLFSLLPPLLAAFSLIPASILLAVIAFFVRRFVRGRARSAFELQPN